MYKRSNIKRMTRGARVIKFLREQAGLSIRGAAAASGIGDGVINHLEHGRIDIHDRHLEKLLKAYNTDIKTYQLFASGSVMLPQNLQFECIEIIRKMSQDQLRTAHPVLLSLAAHK